MLVGKKPFGSVWLDRQHWYGNRNHKRLVCRCPIQEGAIISPSIASLHVASYQGPRHDVAINNLIAYLEWTPARATRRWTWSDAFRQLQTLSLSDVSSTSNGCPFLALFLFWAVLAKYVDFYVDFSTSRYQRKWLVWQRSKRDMRLVYDLLRYAENPARQQHSETKACSSDTDEIIHIIDEVIF